jgi:hypothetical protein
MIALNPNWKYGNFINGICPGPCLKLRCHAQKDGALYRYKFDDESVTKMNDMKRANRPCNCCVSTGNKRSKNGVVVPQSKTAFASVHPSSSLIAAINPPNLDVSGKTQRTLGNMKIHTLESITTQFSNLSCTGDLSLSSNKVNISETSLRGDKNCSTHSQEHTELKNVKYSASELCSATSAGSMKLTGENTFEGKINMVQSKGNLIIGGDTTSKGNLVLCAGAEPPSTDSSVRSSAYTPVNIAFSGQGAVLRRDTESVNTSCCKIFFPNMLDHSRILDPSQPFTEVRVVTSAGKKLTVRVSEDMTVNEFAAIVQQQSGGLYAVINFFL